LLIPLGRLARQIGLLDALDRIPIGMKTIDHSAGDKLAELLAHILAGGMHARELERVPISWCRIRRWPMPFARRRLPRPRV